MGVHVTRVLKASLWLQAVCLVRFTIATCCSDTYSQDTLLLTNTSSTLLGPIADPHFYISGHQCMGWSYRFRCWVLICRHWHHCRTQTTNRISLLCNVPLAFTFFQNDRTNLTYEQSRKLTLSIDPHEHRSSLFGIVRNSCGNMGTAGVDPYPHHLWAHCTASRHHRHRDHYWAKGKGRIIRANEVCPARPVWRPLVCLVHLPSLSCVLTPFCSRSNHWVRDPGPKTDPQPGDESQSEQRQQQHQSQKPALIQFSTIRHFSSWIRKVVRGRGHVNSSKQISSRNGLLVCFPRWARRRAIHLGLRQRQGDGPTILERDEGLSTNNNADVDWKREAGRFRHQCNLYPKRPKDITGCGHF